MEATYTDLSTSKYSGIIINEFYNEKAISNSLLNIFSTPLGTLPGKPYFGTRIHRMVFEPIDNISEGVYKEIIKSEIAKFEPRIEVTQINFESYPEYNKINIEIVYNYVVKEKIISESATIPIKI